ncbi:type IX secretion system PorP/SprF family membrane protein [Flavobacterium arsenatis]|uniref:Type IX secretion system PorP/SprF family membrane protein n=1 Tax=Flavobacterium arsenatis TaxID=1484332 RepID=A0ABU1TMZ7_9FLAO|nr:type IX secretion system membrane protein PorP/SprF [Flavobacterium arsenatis]MDR6967333.1 type IX secretion system PorP/SprF family membrane protein [Flavobacterium arsenatis]
MKIKTIGKSFFCFSLLWLASETGYAQQDSQFTQYMYNPVNFNPAYAGSREVLSIFGMHRTQWVGLDGAPVTNTVSFHTPIANSDLGIGASFVNDRIGPSDENTISVDVSYTVPTSDYFKLAFGLKATANLLNVDYTKLTQQPGDPELQYNIDNRFSPNIGAGVFWYSDRSYVGLSVPNFLETRHFDGAKNSVAKEKMHYHFIGGYVFDLNPDLKFKPSILIKAVDQAPLQADFSANFLFNEKLTLGVAYRWSAALSAMVGFQITDGLLAGYSYDAETTKLANYNSGSHEIFLRFELFKNYDRIISPRFF